MLCERCNLRPATVHLTEITNGQKKETHLCESCAGEIQLQGFGFVPQMNLHNFLAGLLSGTGGVGYDRAVDGDKKCEKCGIAESQFVNKGLLGCGDCYPYFEEKVLPLLRKIHGNTRHTGKVPERAGGCARLAREIEKVKNQLGEAVGREEFELAAELRDAIRRMEKGLNEGREG